MEYNFREIINNSNVLIVITDSDYNITFANKSFCLFFNINIEQAKKNSISIINNKQPQIAANDFIKQNNFPVTIEYKKDNTVKYIKWTISQHNAKENNKIYIFNGADVSDLKQKAINSQINEHRFNILFNNVIDSVFVYKMLDNDKPGYFINVNKIACKTLGYTKEELMKKSILSIDAMESVGDLLYVHKVLNEQRKVVFETVQKTKQGKKIPVEISAHVVEMKQDKLVFAISRDITEQKKEREELRQLSYFAKHNPAPLIRFDKNGTITMINEKAKDVFSKDIIPKKSKIYEIFEELKDLNPKKFIESGQSLIKEIKINQKYYNLTITGVPKLSAGQIYSSDITKIKELSKLKEDFIAIVSHDLRSPFNGILGFSEILLEDSTLTQENRKMIKTIEESAQIQLNYINDLLDLIAAGQKEFNIDLKTVNMDKLVNSSINSLKIIADKKNITIKTDIQKNIKAKLDYPKIIQVLNNLISNALKFTPQDGTIKITSHLNQKNEIETHVIDNGIGIPKNKLENIFDRYSSISTKGTAGEKGSGLGLSICKLLVNAHGGKMKVESAPKKGSDFYFTITAKI